MIVEEISGVNWKVEDVTTPAGTFKVLVLIDQQAARITRVPFSAEVAKEVAAHLSGSGTLIVTRQMPTSGPGAN